MRGHETLRRHPGEKTGIQSRDIRVRGRPLMASSLFNREHLPVAWLETIPIMKRV